MKKNLFLLQFAGGSPTPGCSPTPSGNPRRRHFGDPSPSQLPSLTSSTLGRGSVTSERSDEWVDVETGRL